MTKSLIYLLLLVFLSFLTYQLYGLYQRRAAVAEEFVKNQKQLDGLEEENKNLQADIGYFQNPQNLIKEFKSRFNYAGRGEKLIIVVPQKETNHD